MKVLEFIKKNISIFSVLGFLFITFFIIIYSSNNESACAQGWLFFLKIILVFLSILVFLLDFLFKNIFSSRLQLNLFQLVITIILILFFSFKIYKLS